ncbi:MAG: hypothetical protein ACFCBV_02180 [Phycisphaerales bacterium]
MAGIERTGADGPWTCPECGHQATRERRLRRTRRRWGIAALAGLVLLGSYASYGYPVVRDHGWWRLPPDIVLITLLPHIDRFGVVPDNDAPQNDMFVEVYFERSTTNPSSQHHPWWTRGGLWPWERWLLKHQSLHLLETTSQARVKVLAARLLAASVDHPVPLVSEENKGYAAIAQAVHAYETCESYIDYGVMFKPGGFGRYTMFVTAYERSGRFHQESRYRVTPTARRWAHRVAWTDADGNHFEWDDFRRATTSKQRQFGAVQFGDMYEALMPAQTFFSPLTGIRGPQLWAEEDVRGRSCYVVSGRDGIGRSMTFHIDQDTGLVLRHEHDGMVEHLEPQFNTAIDPHWWNFAPDRLDDSPLLERLDDINAILPDVDLLADPGG